MFVPFVYEIHHKFEFPAIHCLISQKVFIVSECDGNSRIRPRCSLTRLNSVNISPWENFNLLLRIKIPFQAFISYFFILRFNLHWFSMDSFFHGGSVETWRIIAKKFLVQKMKPKKHELKNIVWNYHDDKSKPREKIHFQSPISYDVCTKHLRSW